MDMEGIMVLVEDIMRGLRDIRPNLPLVLDVIHLRRLRLRRRSDLFLHRLLRPLHIRIRTRIIRRRCRLIHMRGVGGMILGVIRGIMSMRAGVILFHLKG